MNLFICAPNDEKGATLQTGVVLAIRKNSAAISLLNLVCQAKPGQSIQKLIEYFPIDSV